MQPAAGIDVGYVTSATFDASEKIPGRAMDFARFGVFAAGLGIVVIAVILARTIT